MNIDKVFDLLERKNITCKFMEYFIEHLHEEGEVLKIQAKRNSTRYGLTNKGIVAQKEFEKVSIAQDKLRDFVDFYFYGLKQ